MSGNGEVSICVCLSTGGILDVFRNGYTATGLSGGRALNVALSWGSGNTQSRTKDNVGIDGGRQDKEEYGSGEGLGKHLDRQLGMDG